MEKEFIPYEQALALKELGFDEPCFIRVWWLNSVHYQTKVPFKPHITMNGQDIKFEYPIPEKHPSTEFDILELQVPTFSQAFRWFREKHNFISEIKNWNGADQNQWYYMIHHNNQLIPWRWVENKSYEEAELACLNKLIEIIKQ